MRYKDRKFLEAFDEQLNAQYSILPMENIEKLQELRKQYAEIAENLIYYRGLLGRKHKCHIDTFEDVLERHLTESKFLEDIKDEMESLFVHKINFDARYGKSSELTVNNPAEITKGALELNIRNFKKRVEGYIRDYENDIRLERRGDNDPSVIAMYNFYVSSYKHILSLPILNKDDLEYVKWLFNDGKLQEEKQILQKQEELKKKVFNNFKSDVVGSEEYDKGYHPLLCFILEVLFLPTLLGFLRPGVGSVLRTYMEMAFFAYIPIWAIAGGLTAIQVKRHNEKFFINDDTLIKQIAITSLVGVSAAVIGTKLASRKQQSKEV